MRTSISPRSILIRRFPMLAIVALGAACSSSGGTNPAPSNGGQDSGGVNMNPTAFDAGAPAGRDAAAPNADAAEPHDGSAAADAATGVDASPSQDTGTVAADSGASDVGPHPTPGVCFPDPQGTGNSLHVGAYCTKGGGECQQYSLACAIDLDPMGGTFCIKLFCGQNSDCGESACCTGRQGNPIKACVPLGCVAGDAGVCPM